MLPELLFAVSSSMQDAISRDDFGLLNGSTSACGDKELTTAQPHQHNNLHVPQPAATPNINHALNNGTSSSSNSSKLPHHPQLSNSNIINNHLLITGTDCTLDPIKLGRTPEHDHGIGIGLSVATTPANAASVTIKLEEPDPIYSAWHTAGSAAADIGSNLLCHSDDPLISGAIDDNQNEFHPIHQHNQQSHHNSHHHQHNSHHSLLHLLPAGPPSISIPCALIKAEEPLIPTHSPIQPSHQHQHLLSDIAVDSTTVPLPPTPQHRRSTSTTSISKRTNASAAPRPRRKGQLKLRFHHQALPQEYLDHYEATQNSQHKRDAAKAAELAANTVATKTRSATSTRLQQQQQQKQQQAVVQLQQQPQLSQLQQQQQHVANMQQSPAPLAVDADAAAEDPQLAAARAHDSVRNWLQKIAEYQHHDVVPTTVTATSQAQLQSTLSPSVTAVKAEPPRKPSVHQAQSQPSTQRILNYSDLPFMGEMTLDNSKPRRGRKPKKADICHLIYKNYGTILPGTPNKALLAGSGHNSAPNLAAAAAAALTAKPTIPIAEDEVVVVSTAEIDANRNTLNEEQLQPDLMHQREPAMNARRSDEPLNLCLRDRSSEPFTILSSDEEAAAETADDDDMKTDADDTTIASTPRPQTAASTSDTDSLLAANMRMSLPNFQSALLNGDDSNAAAVASFIHPMALYYQKMADNNGVAATPIPTHLPGASPAPNASSMHLHYNEPIAKILIPKNISELLRQHQQQQQQQQNTARLAVSSSSPSPSPSSSSRSTTLTALTAPSTPQPTAASSTAAVPALPQKRKRSAIFIPPMPVEPSSHSGNGGAGNPPHHATEVSICKFKFTGGAKPSLQEKKMLSVDAGGNFRYYSGTGDKSMRGYEFFPRESLLASGAAGGSSAGAFLNAAGERIAFPLAQPQPHQQQPQPLDLLAPPSFGLSHEVLQLPSPVDLPSPIPTQQQPPQLQQHLPYQPQQPHQLSSAPDATMLPSTSFFQPAQPNHAHILRPQAGVSMKTSSGSGQQTARKSRRSLQREKLEKTFKEKGFLIQTQQLESAEGATYCKFRQLRKFTRYLFRSWKDYLPGELQQQQLQENDGTSAIMPAAEDDAVAEHEDRTGLLMAAASAAATDANSVGMQEMMLAEHQRNRQQRQQQTVAATVGSISEEM